MFAVGPAYATQAYSQLRALHSGKCVDVTGASIANGVPVQQWNCVGAAQFNQQWALVQVGNPDVGGGQQDYEIVSRQSGKCLDVAGASMADGAAVQQWECLGSNQQNQRVRLRNTGTPGYHRLIFRHSGKCLDVTDVSTANGARLQQWTCVGGQTNQGFTILPIT
jgi:hypothetical protein